MKQILQDLQGGETRLVEVPRPLSSRRHLLIETTRSLVSAGTERMLVEFGSAGLIEKARQQPEKVRQVLDKMRTDGIASTLQVVRSKLEQPVPMGYCNVGRVMEVGAEVSGFAVGDRIASNGRHAEIVCVPRNLCAKIPDAVDDESAAFTVMGAIALQGIRLAAPTLGESVVVTGLGLLGLIAVQLLRAQGCRVLGLDFSPARLALARQFGAETVDLSAGADPVSAALEFSRGRGVDAVLITASTQSSEPVHQAAQMSRKRGRIVLVGVTGLQLARSDFYEKELTFQVSCSYGPGRYDSSYEEGGQDYPVGFVRWTQQRNFEAMLDMLAARALDVKPLISHRFAFDQAAEAYALLSAEQPSLGIVLEYPGAAQRGADFAATRVQIALAAPATAMQGGAAVIGFIGSGNYATQVLIPAFRKTPARLKTVVSAMGVSGAHSAGKHGIEEASTDSRGVLSDPEITAVVIATRHDSHARFIVEALSAAKHVFVEKPLCIDAQQLAQVCAAHVSAGRMVMVGFNRRFAPHVVKIKRLLESVREPKAFVMTVNAGPIPREHWTQDPAVGGGRLIGEGCHFIDLLRFLAAAPIVGVQALSAGGVDDRVSFTLAFADGSIGTVHYLANGHKSFPKERLEVFCGGRVLQLDNFRKLRAFGWPGFKRMSLWRQDKGNAACAAAFIAAIQNGGPLPIPFEELCEVTRVSFEIVRALAEPRAV